MSCTSISVLLGLSGCGTSPILKPEGHIKSEAPKAASTIPPTIRPVPLPPPPEPRAAEVKYSVVVSNQSVRDVLLAIARETKVNVDVHPGVEGLVTLNAIDQTLKQILARIAKQIDMRYEIEGQTIMVMPDSPYLKSYRVDYVNMTRDVTETVGIATQIISGQLSGTTGSGASSGGSSSSGDNNSTLKITNTSKHRFWESLERNIKDLLRETDKLLPEGSSETFVQGRGQNAPAPARAAQARRNAATTNNAPAAGQPAGAAPADTQQTTEYVEQRLTFREASAVIINAEAGIVTVRATGRQQERVAEFLEQVTGSAKRQVMIEATVVEVSLNDQYQSGVDWSALGVDGLGYTIKQNFLGTALAEAPFFQLSYSNPNPAIGGNLSSTVKLLSTFGTTRVLSSPKIMVLNNQTAILKVVDNRVYFTVQANTNQNQTQTVTTFTTTQNVVPIGFIMNVTPQISDGDMVTLNVRPTITKILQFVRDPNPDLARAGVVNQIPETQSREMESVMKVGSGQTAVLGGLMQDSFEGTRNGLPIGSRIPIIGDLMSQRNDTAKKTELVIFIRPIVVKDASILTDLAGYQRFVPGTDFFRDTQTPLPELQENLLRMQRGEMGATKPNPVVPDAVPAENAK